MKLFRYISFFCMLCSCTSLMAQNVNNVQGQRLIKSYAAVLGGPLGRMTVPEVQYAITVEWLDNGIIVTGTGQKWKYSHDNESGGHIYVYIGNNSGYLQYENFVIEADFSKCMEIGINALAPMTKFRQYTIYYYIGEGPQPANDWINSSFASSK